jgi:nitroimidazol reductase NimA-like FMN-containing flavoprotein (pyridoxamine 5'-phosphate oxidase superfamily)
MTDNRAFLSRDDQVYSLSEPECRELLGSRTFGRVGVTSGGLPVILPVRYLYDKTAITFRTGSGTKLRAAAQGDVLAFEVDAFDDATRTGWSVLVLGRASVLTRRLAFRGSGAGHRDALFSEGHWSPSSRSSRNWSSTKTSMIAVRMTTSAAPRLRLP